MNIIVCLDNNHGTMFNHRRQSMDQVVREKIHEITMGEIIWMNAYSVKQFLDTHSRISNLHISEKYLELATGNDYCFVEGAKLKKYENKIKKIYIFYWNRTYPADQYFDLNLDDYKVEKSEDFIGNSHEKITLKTYRKRSCI